MGGKPRIGDEQGRLRDPAFPAIFVMLYQMLRRRALELGYSLAVHGSLARDLDLIAVPWVEDAVSADRLVEELRQSTAAFLSPSDANPEFKPHGRRAWAMHLVGTGTYIDLSVMPRTDDE